MNIAFSTMHICFSDQTKWTMNKTLHPDASVGILNVPSYSCAFHYFSIFGGREIVKPTVMVNLKKKTEELSNTWQKQDTVKLNDKERYTGKNEAKRGGDGLGENS